MPVASLDLLRCDASETAYVEKMISVMDIEVLLGGEGDFCPLKIGLKLALLLQRHDLLFFVPRSKYRLARSWMHYWS